MNTHTKTILVAGALIAAVVSSQAQAQSSRYKPETLHQQEENRWLDLERAQGSGNVAPVPFPPPPAPAIQRTPRPETVRQGEENQWLDDERAIESGNVAPVPFPPPAAATTVDTANGR